MGTHGKHFAITSSNITGRKLTSPISQMAHATKINVLTDQIRAQ